MHTPMCHWAAGSGWVHATHGITTDVTTMIMRNLKRHRNECSSMWGRMSSSSPTSPGEGGAGSHSTGTAMTSEWHANRANQYPHSHPLSGTPRTRESVDDAAAGVLVEEAHWSAQHRVEHALVQHAHRTHGAVCEEEGADEGEDSVAEGEAGVHAQPRLHGGGEASRPLGEPPVGQRVRSEGARGQLPCVTGGGRTHASMKTNARAAPPTMGTPPNAEA